MAQGVRILAVSIDASARDVRRFLKKSTVAFEVLHDPGGVVAGSEFLVHSVPHSFLIDRSGVIVRVWSGGGSDQLIGEIEAALREQVGD